MSGRKKHQEEHPDETWLLPYSDMLTLLLALFIVMFAMSKVDSEKFKQVSEQLNIVFAGGNGVMNGTSGNGTGSVQVDGLSESNAKKGAIEQDNMTEIKNNLEQEIKNEGYKDKVSVNLNGEGVNISIQDTVIFNSGKADVLTDFNPILIKISDMIKNLDNEIRISGYTDNVPIKNNEFRSNWDLSYMRASNVMNFLVNTGHVAPEKFTILSYGEYRPKYSNSTEEGRAKNRSVDILIVRKYAVSTQKTN